jgi:hypothetical protein
VDKGSALTSGARVRQRRQSSMFSSTAPQSGQAAACSPSSKAVFFSRGRPVQLQCRLVVIVCLLWKYERLALEFIGFQKRLNLKTS